MQNAYRLVVCLLALSAVSALVEPKVMGQDRFRISGRKLAFVENHSLEINRFSPGSRNIGSKPNLPTSSSTVSSKRERQIKAEIEATMYTAIRDRLGVPYRSGGTDDRGYDCSGFVWSVFQESGIDLTRTSARTLWKTLPEATSDEETEFGTLVFFEGLTHVGIVRDRYSFYHASTSQGVIRSFYSGYWGEKVIGFRRVPLPKRR